jgi:methionyl-tRNA formyltransferase
MPEPLSIVFAGTPDFSVPALQALLASSHRITAVYTQPDRPAGRGRQLTASPVKACALAHGLPVEQPLNFKDPAALAHLSAYRPDLIVVVAYGLILPPAVLDVPPLGCWNIHASLLPRWRGAAPIQRAILAGDTETGVDIMRMEAGLDTGPVLLESRTAIKSTDTGASLHDRLAGMGAELLLPAIAGLCSGELTARAQAEAGVTYAHKIQKEEARIDWRRGASELDRLVRAFNAWPVAETLIDGEQLRIWEAVPLAELQTAATPGTVLETGSIGIDVATGAGVLRLTRVQAAGRKPVAAPDYTRARELRGKVLGATS